MDPCKFVVAVFAALLALAAPGADRGDFTDETAELHYGRDRTLDVEHLRLDVRFDHAAGEVSGTNTITLSPLNDGLTTLELDAGPMEIEKITLQGVESADELFFRHDGERLHIELPRPYAAGESLTMAVRYSARPRAGLYFVGADEAYPDKPAQVWSQGESEDNRYWFPTFDYPNDKATFEQFFTVPAAWTAVGNGELLGVQENAGEGTRTFHYAMRVPSVSYLVSVVAGELERYADSFDGKPVEYFVPVGTGRETALRSFGETPGMLRFFSESTGVPYPYAKYSQTCAVDFIYGGMENVSATTQTADTLHDETAALEIDSLGLVAHEAAHQWFGDLLTCADWSHAWLNEGFATYWEKLWWEHARGRDEFHYRMLGARDDYLREDAEDYRRPIVQKEYSAPMDLFDSHLYPKGAWVLHMMRGVLGDELFFKGIRHYVATHQRGVVETHDLRRAIGAATGVNLEGLFDQWLYHGGHPELRVTRSWDPEQNLLTLHVEQTQETDAMTPLFDLPLRFAVDTSAGTVERTLALRHARQDLSIELPAEPQLVRIDPGFFVLMELDHERPDQEIVTAVAAHPLPVGRILAARDAAQRLSRGAGVPVLAMALSGDSFWGVRVEAAIALGKLGGAAARDALVAGLQDADARVRREAAAALGEFADDADAAAALLEAFAREPAYGVRAAAVTSLAKIDAPQARKTALSALETASHRETIRVAGIEALAELKNAGDVALLLGWTDYGKAGAVRRAAIAALAKHPGADDARLETVKRLSALLDDPQLFVRREAIEALGVLRATEAAPAIERAARVEQDSRVRRTARRALAALRSPAEPAGGLDELAAEVERLREENRDQARRIDALEREAR